MRRTTAAITLAALALSLVAGCIVAPPRPPVRNPPPTPDQAGLPAAARSAGDATVVLERHLELKFIFLEPVRALSDEQLREFQTGSNLFRTIWLRRQDVNNDIDGLGPLFNHFSCAGCHEHEGRAKPPATPDDPLEGLIVRISAPGRDAHGGPKPHPTYGHQLATLALEGIDPEADIAIEWIEQSGAYPDGTPYTLRRPRVIIRKAHYGPIGDDALLSPRIAPQIIGVGLLELIPEADIRAAADPDDADGDGISGRVNQVHDLATGHTALGRFGWKANQPTLRQQIASAAVHDMGITNTLFPHEQLPGRQAALNDALSGAPSEGEPEMFPRFLDRLEFYAQTIGVPQRRDIDDPQVQRGEQLFADLGCAACHTPTQRTGAHPRTAVISHQTIHPYTDLLLHDMGEGLADDRPDHLATGREWRTPPLWGVGLIEAVNGHTFLLHDGRARNIEEAILWHDGEAHEAQRRFQHLPADDRAALITFIKSL